MTYRDEVLRTAGQIDPTLGALGLAGETGEVVELIKKAVFHGKPFDRSVLIKELGDVRWYLEYLAIVNGTTMEEIEAENVAKLRARFPDGFNHADANAKRDEG